MYQSVLAVWRPHPVEGERWRAEAVEVRRGLSAELDDMGSSVARQSHPRWRWHALEHTRGKW